MGLFGSLEVARSGLAAATDLSTVVSRNIANINKPLATVKTGKLITVEGGNVRMASVDRSADTALFNKLLAATSDASAQQAIVTAADQLDQTVTDPENDASPAALLGKLTDSLQQYYSTPSSIAAAQSAISAATALTDSLNRATAVVQDVRQRADTAMSDAANRLNDLLDQFWSTNSVVVSGTLTGRDITDQLDQRDRILQDISKITGVKSITRENNDMTLYTDSGVALFETTPRSVKFQTTVNMTAGNTGYAVMIDGVPVTGNYTTMPLQSGELAGLSQVRDGLTVTYQNQLDEIARGLVVTFAESDQSDVPTLPDAPGLFTYSTISGAAGVPDPGILVSGIAGRVKVNPAVDQAAGGDPTRLRDGGINGAAYTYNTTGAASYQGRLTQLLEGLREKQPFDTSARIGSPAALADFASSSVAWLEQTRQTATEAANYKTTLQQETATALTAKTGVKSRPANDDDA